MVLPDDPEEHVKFEEKSEDQEGADDATPLEGLLADVTSDDLRNMMMQKMGVDPVNNLSDYLQVQFSNLLRGFPHPHVSVRASVLPVGISVSH